MLSHNEQQPLTKERTNHTVPNTAPHYPARKYVIVLSKSPTVQITLQVKKKTIVLKK
jgi:hypothetical protein